ncbi:hypothetical protein CTEN210_09997 [Chaetoceros tenuissimus]|uniref:VWFA domain-containing protein n=1 Tax=Chaetoceros tenuissimus TaxID=426638 RepID=A0AAD3H7X0_9STRA|nr:hypothetical protein CTEN210_09997 [Chaetoceros tenuissimus]
MASRTSKQAVVYILDASPSMNEPYKNAGNDSTSNKETNKQTKLEAAKEAITGLVTELMLESKTNECSIIVLNTEKTNHHLHSDDDKEVQDALDEDDDYEIMFPKITELCPIIRPNLDLLRDLQKVSVVANERDSLDEDESRQGGFCDGILLAASSMRKKTAGKKFARKIILFTDAERQVDIHFDLLDDAIEDLRDMNCTMTVIGLDFERSAEFDEAAAIEAGEQNEDQQEGGDPKHRRDSDDTTVEEGETNIEQDQEDTNTNDIDMDERPDSPSDEQVRAERVKDDNEMFLISFTKYTGGEVHAASDIQQMLTESMGKRLTKSTLNKIEFHIAPGIAVNARMSIATSRQNVPSLKKHAVSFDAEGNSIRNMFGEIIGEPIVQDTSHWDVDKEDIEVFLIDRADAYAYGSDLIPIGKLDLEGLKQRSPPKVSIIGYVSTSRIPISAWIGPMRLLSGPGAKAGTAISALAQALEKTNQFAIVRYIKQTDADPEMGILSPYTPKSDDDEEESKSKPKYLSYTKIPFADDVESLLMLPLVNDISGEKGQKACDELIDAFMLPDDALVSSKIPNPAIRTFRKTMIKRALDRDFKGIVGGRDEIDEGCDVISTPQNILKKGKDACERFRRAFPLEVVEQTTKKGRAKKKFLLSDSQNSI